MSSSEGFRDIERLARSLCQLLAANAVLAVASIATLAVQLSVRGSGGVPASEVDDTAHAIVMLLQFATLVVTAVAFGRWIVLANRNVRALGAQDLRISPGWAVGYFFVPILNLWKPYQAMQDLWRASQQPAAWKSVPTRESEVGMWWMLWLVSNAVAGVSDRLAERAEMQTSDLVGMVSEGLFIALCLVARAMVAHITAGQRAHGGVPPDFDLPVGGAHA